MLTRRFLLCLVLYVLIGVGQAQAEEVLEAEGPTTVLGGSLLSTGETALTFGGGFPDVLFRFDFANAPWWNLAGQVKLNYNFGLPFFSFNAFITAPVRLKLIRQPKWTLALMTDLGLFLGGGGALERFRFGFPLGLGGMVTLHLVNKWSFNFGIDFPMVLSIDPSDSNNAIGFNFPIELVAGFEVELNRAWTLFLRLSGGPYLYFGNVAQVFTRVGSTPGDDLFVSGSIRAMIGVIWRRNR